MIILGTKERLDRMGGQAIELADTVIEVGNDPSEPKFTMDIVKDRYGRRGPVNMGNVVSMLLELEERERQKL